MVWAATLESGMHASVAAVALGLVTPARPLQDAATARRIAHELPSAPSPREVRRAVFLIRESVSVAERLQDQLHPWSSYVMLPLFALANAGVRLDLDSLATARSSPITVGVAAALALGAPAGVAASTWAATRARLAELPRSVSPRHMNGVAGLAGIGFTMSLFVAQLAFGSGPMAEQAIAGILAGSLLAALLGMATLRRTIDRQPRQRGRRRRRTTTHLPRSSSHDDGEPTHDHHSHFGAIPPNRDQRGEGTSREVV